MKLGENILKLRKKQGLSQEQLGEKVNVTRQTISNWELEVASPNPEQLKLLSKALNISIDELLDNEVKNVQESKISNTEKLSGIVIKKFKVTGIIFIVCLVVAVIALIAFISIRKKQNTTNVSNTLELVCTLDDKQYTIGISEDNSFSCDTCNNDMLDILGILTDTESRVTSVTKIEDYFLSNGGTCE